MAVDRIYDQYVSTDTENEIVSIIERDAPGMASPGNNGKEESGKTISQENPNKNNYINSENLGIPVMLIIAYFLLS